MTMITVNNNNNKRAKGHATRLHLPHSLSTPPPPRCSVFLRAHICNTRTQKADLSYVGSIKKKRAGILKLETEELKDPGVLAPPPWSRYFHTKRTHVQTHT